MNRTELLRASLVEAKRAQRRAWDENDPEAFGRELRRANRLCEALVTAEIEDFFVPGVVVR